MNKVETNIEKRSVLETINLNASYDSTKVIKNISLKFYEKSITAIIGPSGCGKSTLIRTLNRIHEECDGAKTNGSILFEGKNIFQLEPVLLRKQIGMVFQKPNPFPTMSIFQNVASGLILNSSKNRTDIKEIVEESLKRAALWDEVKDKLHQVATNLSGGQQQRLCIARALAVEPKILLLDEPCSALDPTATLKIEDLLVELKNQLTIIVVTHNMQQAARISDLTAFMLLGELIEFGPTSKIFTLPQNQKTQDYITGRFG